MSFYSVPREVFPPVDFDLTTVSTALPGGSPEQVEKLLLNPIEIALQGVSGIKKIRSSATENFSVVTIELDPDSKDKNKTNRDIRNAIESIEDFPEEATTPVITEFDSSSRQPFLELFVEGSARDRKLFEIANFYKDEIEEIPGVKSIEKGGYLKPEISVLVDPKKIRDKNISLTQITQVIQAQNISFPAGKALDEKRKEVLVRTQGAYDEEQNEELLLSSIRDTVIRSNDAGRAIFLKDVAKISRMREKPVDFYRSNGNSAVALTVHKKTNFDGIEVADSIKEKIQELEKKVKGGKVSIFRDLSFYIKRRLNVLNQNLLLALILILWILSLVLPWQVSLVVAAGIPAALLGTIITAFLSGYSLNLLSLLGLIIAIGIVVDDAIVVAENIWKKIEEGQSLSDAAVNGSLEMMRPVTASILTTICAFSPMLFMSGIMGKFIFEIPLMVILCLTFSFLEVFFIMPSHFASWMGPSFTPQARKRLSQKQGQNKAQKFFNSLGKRYGKWVSWSTHRRYLASGLLLGLLVLTGLVAAWKGRFVLFPSQGEEIFLISLEMEQGVPLEEAEKRVIPVEKEILKLKETQELESVKTVIGSLCRRRGLGMQSKGPEYACITVNLVGPTERERSRKEIQEAVREKLKSIEGFTHKRVENAPEGPPQGTPVSIDISGKDFSILNELAEKILKKADSIPGVIGLRSSFSSIKEEWRVIPNKPKMAANGLNATQIANTVRASFDGLTPSSMRSLDEEVEIRVQLDVPKERSVFEQLESIQVGNVIGNTIKLSSVATFEKRDTIGYIIHLNGKRSVNISGHFTDKVLLHGKEITTRSFIKEIRPYVNQLMKEQELKGNYGYKISFSGEGEDTQESMKSLGRAFFMAFLGIFFLLVLTFQNFGQPLLILISIPFGLSGVVWALLLHGRPLSFMSGLGVIALSGVIVNNAIMLIDFVNKFRKNGHSDHESIVLAAQSRLRPILLTTITTVTGMLPVIYGKSSVEPHRWCFWRCGSFCGPLSSFLGLGACRGYGFNSFLLPFHGGRIRRP